MQRSFNRSLTILLVLAMAWLVVGCAESDKLSEEQLAALEERVQARWDAMVARDFEKAWEFATPAYREAFPREMYPLRFSYAVVWELTSIEVLDYDARAAVASVAVRVMSKPVKLTSSASRAVGAVPVTFSERWVLIDGQWWYSANA